jgi:beta-N-acetylhexosaminidase
MVDLSAKPFHLTAEDISWVNSTIASMSEEEKIGQLFINLFIDPKPESARKLLESYPVGGARYMGATGAEVYELTKTLQQLSRIPMLIAANCDSGGDGACKDGTYVATAAAVEASGSEKVAWNTGFVSGREAAAIGVNWNFDPVVDILQNWRNTIVNTRAYGTAPEPVIKYTSAYLKGLRETNIATCIKHFPGDGTEERDQHLLLGVNELSVAEWDETFRKVYQHHIDSGVMSIMAGHIALPEYQYKLNPSLTYQDILPATLSPELLQGLLREDLGFNGLILTDASHMIGMAAAMRREEYVPKAIAAGCDMFLFFNDLEEDFSFMVNGYRNGIITEERLHDALRRILGMKAAIGLHRRQAGGTLTPPKEGLSVIGCEEHLEMARDAADKSITLVKNTLDQLPIRPETHPRIKLYTLYGEMGGIHGNTTESEKVIIEELERAGFEVHLNDGTKREKGKTLEYRKSCDAAIVFSDVRGYASENNFRIRWKVPMSSDIPWYVYEVPTVFVSLNFTTHLIDVPMVKTFINSYSNTREVIRQTISKIMGESEFKGTPNENVWCDAWESRR